MEGEVTEKPDFFCSSEKEEVMANAINWFEIPAVDLQRASKFYSAIFDREIQIGRAHV